jgi:hypothetical protein
MTRAPYQPARSGVLRVVNVGCGLGWQALRSRGEGGQDPGITRNRAEMAMVGGRASPGVRSIPFVTR